MASFLDKFRVQTAKKPVSKFDLSCQHMTTANFMKLQPIYYRNLIPGQQIDIDVLSQVRMEALPVPTYGDARLNIRAFYVPYSLVFKAWSDFITDTVHVYSDQSTGNIPQGVPYFTAGQLMRILVSNVSLPFVSVISEQSAVTSTEQNNFRNFVEQSIEDGYLEQYDFFFVSDDIIPVGGTAGNNMFALKWTDAGRSIYKLLCSLGYNIFTDMSSAGGMVDLPVNALALLAFTKVYVDWFFPSAYYQSPVRVALEGMLNRDINDSGTFELDSVDLRQIFEVVTTVCYDADYFVSAFDNPVGPNNGAASAVSINDPSITGTDASGYYAGKVITDTYSDSGREISANTPIVQGGTTSELSGLYSFSQFAIDSLRALTNYMTRHRLAGAKAIDRLIARFGGAPLSEALKRSVYLGSTSAPLMVRDVMSNAATEGATLGEYAGKGTMFDDNGHFSYKAKEGEYGIIILTASIIPTIGYYQGIDRQNLFTSRLQFYTSEFDGMGTEAIIKGELFDDIRAKFAGSFEWLKGIFGFTPRYSTYKVPRDLVSGDFRCKSKSQVGSVSDSWHLMREFDDVTFPRASEIVHSREFSVGTDAAQYLRIFNNSRDTADHFILNFQFRVTSFAPMLPLYEQYDFHEDTGQSIMMNANGVKMN